MTMVQTAVLNAHRGCRRLEWDMGWLRGSGRPVLDQSGVHVLDMKTVMMEWFTLGGVHRHKSGVRIQGGETMLLAQYLGGYVRPGQLWLQLLQKCDGAMPEAQPTEHPESTWARHGIDGYNKKKDAAVLHHVARLAAIQDGADG
ncbi:hypothetical protein E5D57_014004 [Metarhizium anisopliae]|nr:hypothetical protein E5D57_014004 [Metarhizium anisopliae]